MLKVLADLSDGFILQASASAASAEGALKYSDLALDLAEAATLRGWFTPRFTNIDKASRLGSFPWKVTACAAGTAQTRANMKLRPSPLSEVVDSFGTHF